MPGWAQRVIPDDTKGIALKKLSEAVIRTCRLEESDPSNFWLDYLDLLVNRANHLPEKGYQALTFTGPGTDHKVGLP